MVRPPPKNQGWSRIQTLIGASEVIVQHFLSGNEVFAKLPLIPPKFWSLEKPPDILNLVQEFLCLLDINVINSFYNIVNLYVNTYRRNLDRSGGVNEGIILVIRASHICVSTKAPSDLLTTAAWAVLSHQLWLMCCFIPGISVLWLLSISIVLEMLT